MKKQRLRSLLYLLTILFIIVLLVLYAAEYKRLLRKDNKNGTREQVMVMLDHLNGFRASLNEIEYNVATFLVTRIPGKLELVKAAQKLAVSNIDTLKQLCNSKTITCPEIFHLDSLYRESQVYMAYMIKLLIYDKDNQETLIMNDKKYDLLRLRIIQDYDQILRAANQQLERARETYDTESTEQYGLLGMVVFTTLLILGFIIWRFIILLSAKEALLKRYKFFEESNDGMIVTDNDSIITYANKTIDNLLELNNQDLIGSNIFDFISDNHVSNNKTISEQLLSNIKKNETTAFDFYHEHVGKWIRVSILPAVASRTFFLKDISVIKKAEQEVHKSRRLYEFIGGCNDLILHARDDDSIYREICKIAVASGGFLFAWIGIPNEATATIESRYQYAEDEDYVKDIRISTKDDAFGQGPTGRAYRTGRYYYCNDIANDPIMKSWSSRALAKGFRSSIALPIKVGDTVVSLFTMYAPRPFFFTEEEIQLLVRVTDNISYALTAIDSNAKRKEAEKELLKVTRAIEQSSASVVITNVKGDIEYVNPAFTKLTGYAYGEVIGQNPRVLKTGHTSQGEYENLWHDITHCKEWQGEFLNRKKNGETYWEHATISPILNEQNEITHFVAVKENITERKRIEQRQQQLLDIFENANAYVATCNMERDFLYANQSMRQALEIGDDDIRQYNVEDFRTEYGSAIKKEVDKSLMETGKWTGETNYKTKTGKIVPVMQVAVLHKDESGQNFQISTTAIDLSRVKETEKDLLRLNQELREFSRYLQSVREIEKNKILNEVHDELGQGLAALMIDVSWIKKHLGDDTVVVAKKVDALLDSITDKLNSFSRIYSSVNPTMLAELGLHASMEYLVNAFTKSTKIPARLSSNTGNENIPVNQGLALYRIVQEALTNIKQHAKASFVSVSLIRQDGVLDLQIEDDGIGFSPSGVDTKHHYGILEMRERVYAMDGTFTLVSVPGKGTTLSIRVPLGKQ